MAIDNLTQNTVLRDPTLPRDVLGSKQFATFVEVLGEGEIEGFPSAAPYTKGTTQYNNAALKDVYLNKTPILKESVNLAINIDNLQERHYNFHDVEFTPKFGTSSQTYIPGINNIETEFTVNTDVTYSTSVSRTLTSDIDAVRVTIAVPVLQKINDKGEILGTTTKVTIQITQNDGTVTTPISNSKITGRTSGGYFRDYLISFVGGSLVHPLTVTVKRTVADSTDSKLIDAFMWASYTEILFDRRAYANTAHVALRFDSEQFPQTPARSYRVRGIKVPIPSNGTVNSTTGAISYSGNWDGSFKASNAWTTDPAWILHELLINERFGTGSHISASQLSKYDFYAVSQYCGESVNDGNGGTEPRFAVNGVVQQQVESYRLIADLCSVMRCMPFWNTGSLTISQDSPKDPSYLFTLANVEEGGFTYRGSSLKTRHTVVNVGYFDMETQEIDYEEVIDTTAQSKYGSVVKQIKSLFCTSRGQAARLGRWLLYTEQHESEIVTFSIGLSAGVLIRPGAVIEISDPVRAGVRRGGLINTATTTMVTVDNSDQTDLTTSNSPTLSVVLSDGSVETRTVSNISGAEIYVSAAFSSAPNSNSVWILQNDTVKTTQWRVLSIKEEDGVNYSITALPYNSGKYDYVEDGSTLPTRNTTVLNTLPDSPGALSATEQFYEENGKAKVKIIVSWQSVSRASSYRVQWRKSGDNFSSSDVISRCDFEILDTTADSYEIRVFAINGVGSASSSPGKLTFNGYGKTSAPADITGAYLNVLNSESVELAWTEHPDLDVKLGGSILIRHTTRTSGAKWENATTLVPAISGNQTKKVVAYKKGTYLLRAKDDIGNLSTNATLIAHSDQSEAEDRVVVRVASSPAANVDLTFDESLTTPKFSGNLTNMLYSEERDALIIANGVDIDSITDNIDDWTSIDALGGVKATGEYEFGGTLDLQGVYDLNLRSVFTTLAFNPGNFWDDLPEIDSVATIDDVIGNPDANLYFRYSQDASSPTYSGWILFESNLIRARYIQFKVIAISGDERENIAIDQLGVAALLHKHTESAGPLTSGTTTYTATYPNPFYAVPQVNITALDMASGDYVTITNVTRTDFQVLFKNSGGSNVSRQFYYSATGTGKEVT